MELHALPTLEKARVLMKLQTQGLSTSRIADLLKTRPWRVRNFIDMVLATEIIEAAGWTFERYHRSVAIFTRPPSDIACVVMSRELCFQHTFTTSPQRVYVYETHMDLIATAAAQTDIELMPEPNERSNGHATVSAHAAPRGVKAAIG